MSQEGDEIFSDLANKGGNVAKKGFNKVKGIGTKKLGAGLAKLGGKAIKGLVSLMKTLMSFIIKVLVALGPEVLAGIAVVILIIAVFAFLFESRGSDGRWSLFSENVQNGYFTGENLNAENRAVAQFYKYFSENSYYQVVLDSNGVASDYTPKKPSVEAGSIVRDFYEREKLFYVPSELIFMIDDTLYEGEVRYPEQIIKPIKTDASGESVDLAEDDGEGNRYLKDDTLSVTYDITDEGRSELSDKVVGVWDYGLAPIYEYLPGERYEKVKGEIVDEQVVIKEDINGNDLEPKDWYLEWRAMDLGEVVTPTEFEEFAVRLSETGTGYEEIRDSIYVMHSASTFAGNFKWEYNTNPDEIGEDKMPLLETTPVDMYNGDPVYGATSEQIVVEHVKIEYWELQTGKTKSIRSGSVSNLKSLNEDGFLEQVFVCTDDRKVYYMYSDDYGGGLIKKASYSNYDSLIEGFEEASIGYSEYETFTDMDTGYFGANLAYQIKGNSPEYDDDERGYQVTGLKNNGVVEYQYEQFIEMPPLEKKIWRKGVVVEYAPRISGETKEARGDQYFMDYFNNFSSWVPQEYGDNLEFTERVDQIVTVSLNIGSNANAYNKYYNKSKNYRDWIDAGHFDADLVQAVVAYEISEDTTKNSGDENDGLLSESDVKGIASELQRLKGKYGDEEGILVALCAYNWGEEMMDMFISEYSTSFGGQIIDWVNFREEFYQEYYYSFDDVPKDFNIFYVEDVMSFYDGNVGYDELKNHDKETIWEKLWNGVTDFFTSIRDKIVVVFTGGEKKYWFEKNLSNQEVEEMVVMALTFAPYNEDSYSDIRYEDVPYFQTEYVSTGNYAQMTLAEARQAIPMIDEYVSPIGNVTPAYTSPFGMRMHPTKKVLKLHTGIDLAVPEGTPLISIYDGVVRHTGYDGDGWGNYIVIDLTDGRSVLYAHMKAGNPYASGIAIGRTVSKGTVIGYSGNTGASTGPHLHFEYMMNGFSWNSDERGYIDPYYVVELNKNKDF